MSGVIANIVAVLIGATIGLVAGRFITGRFHEILQWALGLTTMSFSIKMIVDGLGVMGSGALGDYAFLAFAGALVIGGLVGEALDIEAFFRRFGERAQRWVHKRAAKKNGGSDEGAPNIVDGFLAASLLYCIGAMTVLGSIQDGLGDPSTLYLKAALDGTSSVVLASALGPGVALSVIPLAIIQGGLALSARAVEPFMTAGVIGSITAVGGSLILAIGLDLVGIHKIRVANLLPALLVAALVAGFFG